MNEPDEPIRIVIYNLGFWFDGETLRIQLLLFQGNGGASPRTWKDDLARRKDVQRRRRARRKAEKENAGSSEPAS